MLLLSLAVFAVVLGVYILTSARNYSQDGMAFTTLITEGNFKNPLFFQAEHLVYVLLGWAWFKLWVICGYSEGALVPLQVLNSFVGAAGISLYFLSAVTTLSGRKSSVFFSLVTTLILASSYGYWLHSTDVEDQISSNVLVVLAFLILLRGLRKNSFSVPALIALAASMAMATLIHATQILFLPVIMLGLLSSPGRTRAIVIFSWIFCLSIGVAYLSAGVLVHGFTSPTDFQKWALAAPGKGVWGRLGLRNLWQGAQTYADSLVYLQGGPNFKEVLQGNAGWRNLLAIVTLVGVLMTTVLAVAHGLYHRKRIGSWRMLVLALCLFWAAIYSVFNFYWAPEDVQFWISVITPAILLLAITLQDTAESLPRVRTLVRGAFLAGLIAILLANLFTAIIPRADLNTNDGYKQAMLISENTTPDDLIIAPGWDWAGSYIPYFAKRRLTTIIDTYVLTAGGNRDKATAEIREEITSTLQNGGRVFVVRLYNLDENDREYLNRVTGFVPEDFDFARKLAWRSGREEAWEILSLENSS